MELDELRELGPDKVKELFCTGWYKGPLQGLCRWEDRTYFYLSFTTEKFLLFPIEIEDIIYIENEYRYIAGLLGGGIHVLEKVIPTFKLVDYDDPKMRNKTLIWWTRNNIRRLVDDIKRAEPVAIWRRY